MDQNLMNARETRIDTVARQVFRTDLSQPGFAHIELGRTILTSEAFDDLVRQWAGELAQWFQQHFNRSLTVIPQGSFDQQRTTEPHRDGGPDDSVLVLGYEPTSVRSRLVILDFSRAARDRGLSPAEFLERFPPLTASGRQALDGYQTEVTGLDPEHFHVVIINNGLRSPKEAADGMIGVLHQGIIPTPDPTARRMIHSFMLAPAS